MDNEFSFGQRISLLLASILGPILFLLYGMTWKVRWTGEENLEAARAISGKVLYVFWHSRILGLSYTHRFRNAGIMISSSFDGEITARIVKRMGYRVFRGSASRGGAQALLDMIKSNGGVDLSLTVDGPKGPAEMVKAGAIILASNSGLPLVPITFKSSSAWRLKSWDRFIIPKPFSTVEVVIGKHISVPQNVGKDEIRRIAREAGDVIKGIG
ncbi:MAG: lysophospholipid acyltransferase family protein [candidate division Zixibacteria bacterium]